MCVVFECVGVVCARVGVVDLGLTGDGDLSLPEVGRSSAE